MGAFILRRLLQSIIVIFGVIVITFIISRVLGDPVVLLLPPEATPEQRAFLTRDLGLDRPIYVQLAVYISKVIRGDFGMSFRHEEPAMKLLLERVPASLYLSLVATFFSICIALPLGIISAIKRGTIFDRIGMTLALFGQSIPAFWAGIMMILLFAVQLGWFPPSGYGGLSYVFLPALNPCLLLHSGNSTAHAIQHPGRPGYGLCALCASQGCSGKNSHPAPCPAQ